MSEICDFILVCIDIKTVLGDFRDVVLSDILVILFNPLRHLFHANRTDPLPIVLLHYAL